MDNNRVETGEALASKDQRISKTSIPTEEDPVTEEEAHMEQSGADEDEWEYDTITYTCHHDHGVVTTSWSVPFTMTLSVTAKSVDTEDPLVELADLIANLAGYLRFRRDVGLSFDSTGTHTAHMAFGLGELRVTVSNLSGLTYEGGDVPVT